MMLYKKALKTAHDFLRSLTNLGWLGKIRDDLGDDEINRVCDDIVAAVKVAEKRPLTVTLCGSTRFKKEYFEAAFRLGMEGTMTYTCAWFSHADGAVFTPSEEQKKKLDELHLRKIDDSDEIFVINAKLPFCPSCLMFPATRVSESANAPYCTNCGHLTEPRPYVGDSTRREIAYAEKTGKVVRYLEEPWDGKAQA